MHKFAQPGILFRREVIVGLIETVAFGGLRLLGAIQVSWWIILAPVLAVPVLAALTALVIFTLLFPNAYQAAREAHEARHRPPSYRA